MSSPSARSRKHSAAASAAAALSAWCAPCSGRNTSVYVAYGVNSSTSRPPTATSFARTPKSRSRSTVRSGPRAVKIGASSGSVSPSTSVAPGFTIPAFSSAIPARDGPEVLDVVELDVGDHRDLAVDHVGGVPAAPEAHLDDRDVDGHVGEPLQGGGVDDLEVAGAVVEHQLDVGDAQEDAVEVVVGDGLPVPGDALVEPLQVGAGVGAHREPRGHEQGGGDPRRRRLAVGAGDVDGRVLELGRAQQLDQLLHPRQRRRRHPAVRAARHPDEALEVHVAVEPGPDLGRVHCTQARGRRGRPRPRSRRPRPAPPRRRRSRPRAGRRPRRRGPRARRRARAPRAA